MTSNKSKFWYLVRDEGVCIFYSKLLSAASVLKRHRPKSHKWKNKLTWFVITGKSGKMEIAVKAFMRHYIQEPNTRPDLQRCHDCVGQRFWKCGTLVTGLWNNKRSLKIYNTLCTDSQASILSLLLVVHETNIKWCQSVASTSLRTTVARCMKSPQRAQHSDTYAIILPPQSRYYRRRSVP